MSVGPVDQSVLQLNLQEVLWLLSGHYTSGQNIRSPFEILLQEETLENLDYTFNDPSHLHCSYFILLMHSLLEANRGVLLQKVRQVALEVNLKNLVPAEYSTVWVPLNSFSNCNFLVVILQEVCGLFAAGFVLPYISTLLHHL